MTTHASTSDWKQIDLPILRTVEMTTEVCELARAQWPLWAASAAQFRRIGAYRPITGNELQSTAPSSGILAALLTERFDLKDWPKVFNYNIYLIAETTDGRLFQSSPLRPMDPQHHSSSPSTWFESLRSPL